MTVCILISNYIRVDSGNLNTRVVGVFTTREQAEKRLEKEIVKVRKDFDYCDTQEKKTKNGWSIWDKEWELAERCDLTIQTKHLTKGRK